MLIALQYVVLLVKSYEAKSASVQIDIRKVNEAMQYGITFSRKSNQEIAVGLRPDQFMNYVLNASAVHKYGKQTATFDLITRASSLETISDEALETLSKPRKRIVQTISRLSRQGNFQQQVLHAYGFHCAVTRAQLRLVDAAHILPVKAPGSVDHVRNGLALAPTYHRAFDSGLIFLDDSYKMRINPEKEAQLRLLRLHAGFTEFKSHLGKIYLPPDKNQWPDPAFIKKANRFRQI